MNIISHRLSNTTLIGDGHIIEQGAHFELLKQSGKYAEFLCLCSFVNDVRPKISRKSEESC